MDSSNFSAYKNGRKHKYYGGLAKRPPVRLTIPRNTHWYVTVDLMGLRGKAKSSITVEPTSLPTIKQRDSLSSIPSLARNADIVIPTDTGKTYDVFISHASEDKDTVARPLAKALSGTGLSVWFDEFEMKK